MELIVKTAKCLLDEKYISAVENERAIKSDRSESDIRMRDRIFREHFGESMPRCPNDILGTEYIKALMKLIFMKVTAVIAEYNLFHNGHIRQLEYIREHDGEDVLRLVIMSGN